MTPIRLHSSLLFALVVFQSGAHGLGFLISREYMEPCERGAGACMSSLECGIQGGTSLGSCSLGVCCKIEKTCNQRIVTNNTFFISPGTVSSSMSCSIAVEKKWHPAGICQMRLDFQEFDLAGPSFTSGMCIFDTFTVSGVDRPVPVVCGLNDGQHMYLDVRKSSNIKLIMNTGSNSTNRRWKIGVRQIPCNSERLAPAGCLQYFETPSGYLKSFNYGSLSADASYPLNMNYAMCFRDSCRVTLQQSGLFGLGDQNKEEGPATSISDTSIGVDKDCWSPRDSPAATKAYLTIDGIRFCHKKFMQTYETAHAINSIIFTSPVRENERSNYGNAPFNGFNLRYRMNCAGTGK